MEISPVSTTVTNPLNSPEVLASNIANFGINLTGFFKILAIIASLIYVGFAFVLIKQVSLMNKGLDTSMRFYITLISYVLFFVSIGVLLFSVIFL
jgi:hypothetical protein